MYSLYVVTLLVLIVSLLRSRQKTAAALRIAVKRLLRILPAFVTMLILVSVVLFFVPDEAISRYLGAENRLVGVCAASLIGSITMMPGFIAFPLSGILLHKGVPYMVLSAFTTTLMMVGVLTYPIEQAYFGPKLTIVRNVVSFCIALVVAAVTGVAFGEIFR